MQRQPVPPGLIRNGGRVRLICDHSVKEDVLQAIHSGQLNAETVLQQTARPERQATGGADKELGPACAGPFYRPVG